MGLVRKANVDSVAGGEDGSIDIGTMIRRGVAEEIERQRLLSLQAKSERESEVADEGD